MENNWNLGNKKALFYNLRFYYQAIGEDYTKCLPLTFHIQHGKEDKEYHKVVDYYMRRNDEIKELVNILVFNFAGEKLKIT
jgi:tubulin monoglycylase TTLL3/8